MSTKPHPVIALIEDEDVVAVRFASIDECYAWEEAHPGVEVISVRPLITKAEANKIGKAKSQE